MVEEEHAMKQVWKRAVALLLTVALYPCGGALAEETVQIILNAGTTQTFTEDALAEEDLTTILEAGLSATSAINQQPWFFAVVTNQEVMAEINANMTAGNAQGETAEDALPEVLEELPESAPVTEDATEDAATASAKAGLGDAPVAIIIYMDEATASPNASFDCGLACQSMVIAANALGYGTKIISSPTMALNGEHHDALCETLGVDSSLSAVAVLLVGVADTQADGYAGASERSLMDEKVSFVE